MLHEILLSLSGHTSPLLSATASKGDDQQSRQTFPGLSPPEEALLASLAHLADLHIRLRSKTSAISSSHPSIVCRTVSTVIVSTHLAKFQQTILDVESSVLKKDASIVGGYGIVPLSKIVDEFDQWTRRMEWFWEIAQYILPDQPADQSRKGREGSSNGSKCSGAALMNRLRKEAQTGYPDLEEAALSLTKAGETAWLRQLSAWVLYGRLPAFGKEDFFVYTDTSNKESKSTGRMSDFLTHLELAPEFVTPSTASSIVFIGKSLNQIRTKGKAMATSSLASRTSPELALVPAHLQHLSVLSSPISKSSLSSAISAIRLSLSQNSLQHLLPLHKIQEVLGVLSGFFLLDRGEFAMALLDEADKCIRSRHRRPTAPYHESSVEVLRSITMKEGEVNAVLSRTWVALSSSQAHDDDAEEELDLARGLMRLSLSGPVNNSSKVRRASPHKHSVVTMSDVSFDGFLFATPTMLTIQITSPLDLFLTPTDMKTYSHIHSYILSIRRAHLHLTELWRLTSLRRDHPAPAGSPLANTHNIVTASSSKRQRELTRRKLMREIWATTGATLFLLAELIGYFQGEVIKKSLERFHAWLQPKTFPSPSQPAASTSSRPTTAASTLDGGSYVCRLDSNSLRNGLEPPSHVSAAAAILTKPTSPDPETLTVAHQRYLKCLAHTLLLTDKPFTRLLHSFLTQVDHFVALITRLHSVQQNIDTEVDDGVVDPLADYAAEEQKLIAELRDAKQEVDGGIKVLVTRLRDIDSERVGGDNQPLFEDKDDDGGFIPWSGGGLDRLLMKLDFANLAMDDGRPMEDE
ncbi:hypothetical protein MMC16_006646 [Acarospora aff. strigata]|nr:hypothetical protein [Acarospora aff. strigata]